MEATEKSSRASMEWAYVVLVHKNNETFCEDTYKPESYALEL